MQIIAAITKYIKLCFYSVLILAGVIYFLFATTAGAEIIIRSAMLFLPGKITLGVIQGALYDRVECQNISYTHQQNTIQIDHLSFVWLPLHLLNKKIVIKQLDFNDVSITLPIGTIHFGLKGEGQWGTEDQQFKLQLTELAGNIKQLPVKGSAHIDYQKGRLSVQPLQAHVGEALLSITGSVTDHWDLHWQLHIDQLQKIMTGMDASVHSYGQIFGPTRTPEFKAQFAVMSVLQKSKGQLQGSIHIGGNTAKLIDYIDLQLINGEVSIPSLNVVLQKIALQSQYVPSQPLNFSGSFLSFHGQGQVKGSVALNTANYPVTVQLDAENIQVANLAEYKINASPHILIDYIDQTIKVAGKIEIPYASVTPKDFANITTLPSEVEFVNQSKEQTALMPNLEMDLHFLLGKDIYLAYENLQTTLQGNVTISQHKNNLPIATGELSTINGKYLAYGKQFKIGTGRLIYAGNILSNPGLDIRATHTINTVDTASLKSQFDVHSEEKPVYLGSNSLVVGIAVTGTLKNPLVSVFSNAELSQKDILSYMLFGYPATNIKDADKLGLLTTALSQSSGLGVKQITKKIKSVLGLSELTIGSKEYFDAKNNSTMNNTSLTVGKQIGKRLSLQYSIGLFNPISIFSLRYQINKRLSIQSETSTIDTGADLVYEYEKD